MEVIARGQITIWNYKDGDDAYSIILNHDTHAVACDPSGNALGGELGPSGKAVFALSAYRGSTKLTMRYSSAASAAGVCAWKFGTISGCTAAQMSGSNEKFYINTMTADSGYVEIVCSVDGKTSITKRVTVVKQKKGDSGEQGEPGTTGKQGCMIRPRGTWTAQTQYVYNDQYRDVVIYNNSVYIVKATHTSTVAFDSSKWEAFNEFINVATSVLLAGKGYVDILGAARLFVGDTNKSTGWEMTNGYIKHTKSGLTLTADGKLYDPDGLHLSVGGKTVQNIVDGAVDNIQVGGRNIVKNSDFSNGTTAWNLNKTTSQVKTDSIYGTYLEFKHAGVGDISGNRISQAPFYTGLWHEVGKTYSLSFYAKAAKAVNIKAGEAYNLNTFAVTTQWKRYAVTYVAKNAGSLTFNVSEANVLLSLTQIKLEESTKVSDWSPAPEDLTEKIEENATQIQQNAKEIALKASQASVDSLSGRMSTAEANISVQAGQIASKASQSSVNTLTNRVTTAESSIKQNATNIALKVSKTEFDALQVGGRNLARETSCEWCPSFNLTNGTNQCFGGFGTKIYLDSLSVGDNIIISFDYKWENFVYGSNWTISLQGTGNVTQWNSGAFPTLRIKDLNLISGANGTAHIKQVKTITADHLKNKYWSVNIRHDYITGSASVRNFKVEKGNRATDWTQAPEDLNAVIGGENLIDNSSFSSDLTGWQLTGSGAGMTAQIVNKDKGVSWLLGYPCLELWHDGTKKGIWRSIIDKDRMQIGDTFTVSFDLLKRNQWPYQMYIGVENAGPDATLIDITNHPLNVWQRVKVTQTVINNGENKAIVIYGAGGTAGAMYIKNIKAEKGSIATSWTPAPTEQNTKLLATGIDIYNKKMIFTADNTVIQDNAGKQIAMFTTVNGKPLLKAENIDVDNLKVKYLQGATGTFKGVLEAASGSFNGELVVSLLRTRLYTVPGGKSSFEVRPDVDKCCNYYFGENHVSSGNKYPSKINVLLPQADFYEGMEISFFRMVTNNTSPYQAIISTIGKIYFLNPYDSDPNFNYITTADQALISANKRVVFKSMDGKWFNIEGNCYPIS